MVTAIVIPIIFLYFYWITKRDMKEHDLLWMAAGDIEPEAIVSGQIKDMNEGKERFYYHRWHYIHEIKLQTLTGNMTVYKRVPLTKDVKIEQFRKGDTIRVYGKWEKDKFFFSKYDVIGQT